MDCTLSRKTTLEYLPSTIIEQILYTCDPNTFSTLILLNRRWHRTSQHPHLYAYQLSNCFYYSLNNQITYGPHHLNELPNLRQRFAIEVKRNLFASYLNPRQTLVQLISVSPDSAAAFPQGEAFRFFFSPNAQLLLALSSFRVYVLDIHSSHIKIVRQLKAKRRPASAWILDDASVLVILFDDEQLHIYSLENNSVKLIRCIALESAPRTVAISPSGSVLAVAYAGGIEVYSLSASALPTDRRAVKCDPVDALEFSADGKTLLGTTLRSRPATTILIFAPGLHEGDFDVPVNEVQSRMWTSSILFPSAISTDSCGTLIPCGNRDDQVWALLYDARLETWKVVRSDELERDHVHFAGLRIGNLHSDFLPAALPCVTDMGDMAATVLNQNSVWIFGFPEDLDNAVQARVNSRSDMHSYTEPSICEDVVRPRWSTMNDKDKKFLLKGCMIGTVSGVSGARFVSRSKRSRSSPKSRERLVIITSGGVNCVDPEIPQNIDPGDSGRILVFDFDWGLTSSERVVRTLEVGENVADVLPEKQRTLETEVALARRKTVAQRRGGLSVSRIPSERLRRGRRESSHSVSIARYVGRDADVRSPDARVREDTENWSCPPPPYTPDDIAADVSERRPVHGSEFASTMSMPNLMLMDVETPSSFSLDGPRQRTRSFNVKLDGISRQKQKQKHKQYKNSKCTIM